MLFICIFNLFQHLVKGDFDCRLLPLQDRILRILSYTTDTTETIYLYFNNQYTADPPSYSLYEDESVLGSIYQGSVNDNSDKIKTYHNMFTKPLKCKLVDTSSTNSSYFIEGNFQQSK